MDWRKLSLREQVFQTIVAASREIKKAGGVEAFFEKYPVGGLYFTKGATPDLAPVMESGTTGGAAEYLLRCKKASRYPLIVCADGANIDDDGKSFPAPSALGATGDEDLAYRAGRAIGMQMNYNHVDWVLSPCIDLGVSRVKDTISAPMTDDPELNCRMYGAMIRGIQDMGVAACAKHFPGLGTHHVNFHYGPGQNTMDMDAWHKTYGATYRSAFQNGVLTVMTSHLTFPAYDGGEDGRPPICTYSERLTQGLLKKELGFRGAVVTDALCMDGLASGDQVMDAVNAFRSGADFLLWAPMEAGDKIVELIESGEIPYSRLEDALTRIYYVREVLGMTEKDRAERPADKAWVDATFEEICRRAVALERNGDGLLPLSPEKTGKILLIANAPDEGGMAKLLPLCDLLRARGFEVGFRRYLLSCWEEEIKRMTDGYDLVVLLIDVPFAYVGAFPNCASTTWAFHLVPKQRRMILNFSLPYFFDDYYPDDHTFINANQAANRDSLALVAKMLTGELPFDGKTPFALFQ